MGKIGDSEARRAAKTIRKYCNKHKHCEGCIFDMGNTGRNCLLLNKVSLDWIKQLDTLRGLRIDTHYSNTLTVPCRAICHCYSSGFIPEGKGKKMTVEEMQNSEVKDYLLEHLEIGVLFSKLTEKAHELSKAATMRAEIMGFNPNPAEVVRAEGILRKNMAEVILICDLLACNTDALEDVEDMQEEIARKWVELMVEEKGEERK